MFVSAIPAEKQQNWKVWTWLILSIKTPSNRAKVKNDFISIPSVPGQLFLRKKLDRHGEIFIRHHLLLDWILFSTIEPTNCTFEARFFGLFSSKMFILLKVLKPRQDWDCFEEKKFSLKTRLNCYLTYFVFLSNMNSFELLVIGCQVSANNGNMSPLLERSLQRQ